MESKLILRTVFGNIRGKKIDLARSLIQGKAMRKFVQNGDEVEIHYTGKLKNDEVFDSTTGESPFRFVVGSDDLIVGFCNGLIGMEVGERRTFEVPPDKAYGEYDEKLCGAAPTSDIPSAIKEGSLLKDSQGSRKLMVKEIRGRTAYLDGNHPLAGKTLVFDVELLSITRPSASASF